MNTKYRQLLLYVMLFVTLLLLVPHSGHPGDVDCWARWAVYIHDSGLRNVYSYADVSYNPLYMYVLWVYAKLLGNEENIRHYVYSLKAVSLLFDFGGAILVSRLVAGRERQFWLSLLLLFNIGYLYNTLAWHQVDTIFTFFVAAAVLLALRGKLAWSGICYLLAVNMKPQAFIFLPPLLFLWLPLLRYVQGAKIVLALGLVAGVQLLILTPFLWMSEQNAWPQILKLNVGATNIFPYITVGVCNLWPMLMPDKFWLSDTLIGLGGLSYRTWGLFMFMSASAIGLFPLLLLVIRSLLDKRLLSARADVAVVFLSFAIVPLVFVYFMTQMHERYWHPALLMLAAYSMLTRRYLLLIVLSAAYFLQLEKVLRALELEPSSFLQNNYFIGSLFTIVVAGSLLEVYRLARINTVLRDIKRRLWPNSTETKNPSLKTSFLPPRIAVESPRE